LTNSKDDSVVARQVLPKIDSITREISQPSAWFRAVQKGENVSSSYIWHVNKEDMYDNYQQRVNVYYTPEGIERLLLNEEPKCHHMKYSHEEMILPNGKTIAPIRQFCDTKILPPGTKEAFFFDFETVYKPITEGVDPTTITPTIRSANANPIPRGTRLTIGYSNTEESPIDMISAINRSFSLESINDETKTTLYSFNNDSEQSKKGRWLDNHGNQIEDDSDITEHDKLTLSAIRNGINCILNSGLNGDNIIFYTKAKAMSDLISSEELKDNKIYGLKDIEDKLGIKIIVSGACPPTSQKIINAKESFFQKIKRFFTRSPRPTVKINGKGCRSVLFLPKVAFGLVVGRDLTMEAQRRNEIQAIHITGTQRTASVLKKVEATCRISHR